MLNDEEIVKFLVQSSSNYLTVIYDGLGDTILKSHLAFPNKGLTDVEISSVETLIRLEFLLEVEAKKLSNGTYAVKYKLPKRVVSMFNTVKKFGVLRLEEGYRNLEFLDLAKTAVIVSHASGGMVDFKYRGIAHTVRRSTSYSFFESQYNLSKHSWQLYRFML